MSDKAHFYGELIYTLRMEHGVSQRALQAATGVHRTFIRRIEYGEAHSVLKAISDLERLLDYFGYELEVIQKPDHAVPAPSRPSVPNVIAHRRPPE